MKSGFPHIFSQTLHHNNNKNENEPKSPQHTTRLYTIITLTNSQVYRFLTNKMAIEIGLTFCYITTSPRRRPLLDRKMREFEPSSKSGLTQLILAHSVSRSQNIHYQRRDWCVGMARITADFPPEIQFSESNGLSSYVAP